MRYEEQAPSVALSDLISRFWIFEAEEGDPAQINHVVMPDGACNLTLVEVIPSGDLHISLSGPSSVAMRVQFLKGMRFQGIRIQPGAVRAFLGVDAATVIGKSIPLAMILPDIYATLGSRLSPLPQSLDDFSRIAEEVFAARTDRRPMLDGKVQQVVTALIQSEGSESLKSLLQSSGLSERQLRRRFVAEVGLTPKVFSRLRRVRRACADLVQNQSLGVAGISYEHGFADQAHFSRELRSIFGLSPQLLQEYLGRIQHDNVVELAADR
jgi:AraC-like DNA-binding protein